MWFSSGVGKSGKVTVAGCPCFLLSVGLFVKGLNRTWRNNNGHLLIIYGHQPLYFHCGGSVDDGFHSPKGGGFFVRSHYKHYKPIQEVEPSTFQVVYLDVSENSGFSPQIIHGLIGFSIIFTIHFGVPLFLETPKKNYGTDWSKFETTSLFSVSLKKWISMVAKKEAKPWRTWNVTKSREQFQPFFFLEHCFLIKCSKSMATRLFLCDNFDNTTTLPPSSSSSSSSSFLCNP